MSQGKIVNKPGFRIVDRYPVLGCSPDGIFRCGPQDAEKLIEIKCPYSIKDFLPEKIIAEDNFYMKYDEQTQNFTLKKTHNYYYQVQGMLNLLDIDTADFIVFPPKNDLIIETIQKDPKFWEEKMLPHLQKFYFFFFFPRAGFEKL